MIFRIFGVHAFPRGFAAESAAGSPRAGSCFALRKGRAANLQPALFVSALFLFVQRFAVLFALPVGDEVAGRVAHGGDLIAVLLHVLHDEEHRRQHLRQRLGLLGAHAQQQFAGLGAGHRLALVDLVLILEVGAHQEHHLIRIQGIFHQLLMGVGAVFPSPTKTNAVRITNAQLHEIVSAVSIPAVAIGGISYDNVCEIKGSSVSGVAVVSAIFGAEDIEKATTLLKERVKAVVEK